MSRNIYESDGISVTLFMGPNLTKMAQLNILDPDDRKWYFIQITRSELLKLADTIIKKVTI